MGISLDQILQSTRAKVRQAKRLADLAELEGMAERHEPRGFRRMLAERSRTGVAVTVP